MESRRVREIHEVVALKGDARWLCSRKANEDYWLCGRCRYGRLKPFDATCFNCHAEIEWNMERPERG